MLLNGARKICNTQLTAATSNANLILQVSRVRIMFDFQVSKHPYLDNACRQFAQTHNLTELARKVEMKAQVLRNKLNPEQLHQLTLTELMLLTDASENAALIDDDASARLTDAAQRDYFTLKKPIVIITTQLTGLQQYIKEQCLN